MTWQNILKAGGRIKNNPIMQKKILDVLWESDLSINEIHYRLTRKNKNVPSKSALALWLKSQPEVKYYNKGSLASGVRIYSIGDEQ